MCTSSEVYSIEGAEAHRHYDEHVNPTFKPQKPKLKRKDIKRKLLRPQVSVSSIGGITPHSSLEEVSRNLLVCKFCPLSFTKPSSLKEHVNGIHLRIKMFHCKMCGEAFKWRSLLSSHRKKFCPFTDPSE